MKTAYIITCHDVYNFGASLQAYALQKYLNSVKVDAEIIDYKPDYLYRLIDFMEVDSPKWQKNIVTRNIYRLRMFPVRLSYLNRWHKFKKFNKTFLSITKHKYKTNKELNKLPVKDIYICGSDQIWNSYNYPCGKDKAFFLGFAPDNSIKVSYAASFGADCIDNSLSGIIKNCLKRFTSISVREKSGLDILSDIGVPNGKLVVDPVLLLNSDEWKKTINLKSRMVKEKYILVYGFDNLGEINSIAEHYKNKLGVKVVSLFSSKLNSEDLNMFNSVGPTEFLDLIKNAEMIITNSFHATAFSVIFKKNFIVVDRQEKGLGERLVNILKLTGLEDRKWNVLKNKSEFDNLEIDYSKISSDFNKLISSSKKFIQESLKIEDQICS